VIATAVVPIRSFDGLTRLASELDGSERAALMRNLAERTTRAAVAAGATVAVVTGDPDVAAWAGENGHGVVQELAPGGLDSAATLGIASTTGPWIVVHADLPAVTPADIAEATGSLTSNASVLAPSHDGGTSLIGGVQQGFPFAYGVGSFRRHVAAAPSATILVRPGLALDLDRVRDLEALKTLGVI
jgi:2-phospho-L-lactate/phosphoenolpyruvate guanylyltransferase